MTRMTGPSDYRSLSDAPHQDLERTIADEFEEYVEPLRTAASDVVTAIKERPNTTLAIAGGLAFTIGALWMLRQRRPQSQMEQLMARMPDLPSGNQLKQWANSWRR